ncbi:Prepilin-type cleavage/methylation protein [Lactobacillus sp. LL6]|uniref:Prepilin-type cleavage/methylation protein n=1 Tax=Lactobacillus sp. LL6 TaxID=2596827 RepID=UPI001F5B12A1|nr:Prepilin-type cleavage/methylation protein [Lactobacillus sp. LL6]
MESYENQLLLVNTEKQVKTAIEQAARISTVQHESISVMYLPDSSYLQFKGRKYSKKVIINKKIKLTNPTNFQISSKGAVAPRTITFSNGKDNKKLKLQMMWGRAIDE